MDNSQNNAGLAVGDTGMSYSHMSLQPDRRDALPSNITSQFQSHQSLNQALGTHLPTAVGPRGGYQDGFRISQSPPGILAQQDGGAPGPSTHSPLQGYAMPGTVNDRMRGVAPPKRKPDTPNGAASKRRRDTDDVGDDGEGQHGAKHWTDEEKTRLFSWLMAPGEDDHWNSLRSAKNGCLRECALEVFGGKKTYQALKGCYERNFNVFKQIYAFESWNAGIGNMPVNSASEGDRLREYERRIQASRKTGIDMGSINARTIDHWHKTGWYDMFFHRWHGDPATTRVIVHRPSINGGPGQGPGDDGELDDDGGLDFADPPPPNDPALDPSLTMPQMNNHMQTKDTMMPMAHSMPNGNPNQPNGSPIRAHTQQPTHHAPPLPAMSNTSTVTNTPQTMTLTPSTSGEHAQPATIQLPHHVLQTVLALLQTTAANSSASLELLRRREAREEREARARTDGERVREAREAAVWEHEKAAAKVKQRVEAATELLANPGVDASVKQAAGDYLKNLFMTDS